MYVIKIEAKLANVKCVYADMGMSIAVSIFGEYVWSVYWILDCAVVDFFG